MYSERMISLIADYETHLTAAKRVFCFLQRLKHTGINFTILSLSCCTGSKDTIGTRVVKIASVDLESRDVFNQLYVKKSKTEQISSTNVCLLIPIIEFSPFIR